MSLPTHSYLLSKYTEKLLEVVVTIVWVSEDPGTHQVSMNFSRNISNNRYGSVSVAYIPSAVQIHSGRKRNPLFLTLLQLCKLLETEYIAMS